MPPLPPLTDRHATDGVLHPFPPEALAICLGVGAPLLLLAGVAAGIALARHHRRRRSRPPDGARGVPHPGGRGVADAGKAAAAASWASSATPFGGAMRGAPPPAVDAWRGDRPVRPLLFPRRPPAVAAAAAVTAAGVAPTAAAASAAAAAAASPPPLGGLAMCESDSDTRLEAALAAIAARAAAGEPLPPEAAAALAAAAAVAGAAAREGLARLSSAEVWGGLGTPVAGGATGGGG